MIIDILIEDKEHDNLVLVYEGEVVGEVCGKTIHTDSYTHPQVSIKKKILKYYWVQS